MTKVLIVGGGVAGLSAGSFLQMNGYETEIFELHRAGGLCTSWKRKGYTIDGCIHWWVGINPKDPFYQIWNELLDMENFPKVVYEEFCSIKVDDKAIRFLGNLDRFENELKTISPQDCEMIEEMISMARKMTSFHMPVDRAVEVMNLWEKLWMAWKMLFMKRILNTWKISLDDYAKKFISPLIKRFLSLFSWWEAPLLGILSTAAAFHNKNAGYPLGGAEELVNRLVKRYVSLGGKIHEKARVIKIIVEGGYAKGLQLQDGKTLTADTIVSAADGHDTLVNMLGEQYADENSKKVYFSGKYVPKHSQLYVSIGVAKTFESSFKPYVYIPLKTPLRVGEAEIKDLGITIHNFDPSAAPAGKTLLTMMIPVYNTDYWVKLRDENRAEYNMKKEAIAQHLIEEIDNHFGDIKGKVEMIDVATPATFIRYTNNWKGSPMAWQDFSLSIHKPKKEIQGLKNFYMCGHWVGDFGIPGAAKSGRDVAQILCKRDGKKFKTLSF